MGPMSPSSLRIAWRNLGRNFKRTLMAGGAIALGQFSFLAVCALLRGFSDVWLESITGPLMGHAQIHAPEWREDRSVDLTVTDLAGTLRALRQDPAMDRAMPRMYAPVLAALTDEGFMAVVVGVEPTAEAHSAGLLPDTSQSGRLGGRRVLVGRALARREGIEPGMEIAVVGQDVDGSIASELYRVEGVLASAVDLVSTMGLVVSLEDAQDLLRAPDQAHEIVLRMRDAETLDESVARLRATEEMAGLEVLPWRELAAQLVTMVEMLDAYTFIILIIVFVAAAAGIANTMLMSTFERTRELGMLLSLGCRPGRLGRIILLEAVILGLVGVGVGTGLGWVLVLATAESGLDYAALGGGEAYEVSFKGLQLSSMVYPKMYARDVISGVAAVALTALAAVAWPAWHVARMEPVEAMRS